MYYNLLIIFVSLFLSQACGQVSSGSKETVSNQAASKKIGAAVILPGADQLNLYLPKLRGKRISLVVNHTSLVDTTHLVDTLLASDIKIVNIFAPEHGFRGKADAGEHVDNEIDGTTGIPIISLYGSKRGPSKDDLSETDLVIFDIQDVGARFYTYISTMHYVMEACAESRIPFMVLDRPNPNGHYVDGPIREEKYKSFVGMHPVPVVYGMTIGEYAQMINGEGWLDQSKKCKLEVVPIKNYTHQSMYELPKAPSPNLPNLRSILLYPSLCFFEGTPLSIGRGTTTQFQIIGHPDIAEGSYTFTPKSMFGAAHPKLKDKLCRGESLVEKTNEQIFNEGQINLNHLLKYFHLYPDKATFFNKNKWIDKLAGTSALREDILAGKSEEEIRKPWQPGLDAFREVRKKYLIYD